MSPAEQAGWSLRTVDYETLGADSKYSLLIRQFRMRNFKTKKSSQLSCGVDTWFLMGCGGLRKEGLPQTLVAVTLR
jgi:hypothetical protein